jgi:uncharacterized protein (DUF2147 family)
MWKIWLAATALACLSSPVFAADASGDWFVADKTAVIRIAPCAEALCGTIAWTQKPGTDTNNPDPAQRHRNIVGVQILLGMKPAGLNRWKGEIYNTQDGKIYAGRISLVSANVLRIEGCLMGFLCGGENWSRAQCEEAPAAPAPRTQGADQSGRMGALPPAPLSCRALAP